MLVCTVLFIIHNKIFYKSLAPCGIHTHAPRPLFSSRLKSQHHGFHRDPSIKTFPPRPIPTWAGPIQITLRVFVFSLPSPGFLVVVPVAPLVHGRFVSLLPRTSRHASLSSLHGRKVYSPRQYVSIWASGDLRSSALMALLPGIALPPCSLGRCSATKICDPLAVGRVRTSRLVYDPSPHLSLRHPVVQLQPPF